MRLRIALLSAALVAGGAADAAAGTLDEVKARGVLNCVVNAGLAGFGVVNDQGVWVGLDVELCRAVAAAVLGDATKVNFVASTAKERFTRLQTGEGDMLARNSSLTLSRDTELALDPAGINFYDGQGFMVRKDSGITSPLQLSGAHVCVVTGTTAETNLADFFRTNGLVLHTVVSDKPDLSREKYEAGQCDVFTSDSSNIASERSALADPGAHVILPDRISKSPLGPLVRQGDSEWADVVRWTLYAMIAAEEFGVTSQNVQQMLSSENPEIRRLLGVEGDMGSKLGLANDWAVQIIVQVGNYGESFARNVGVDTPLGLERGLNAQWTNGGLLYAPPIR
jgi:general L-amino acid transport system substrate-binding protein